MSCADGETDTDAAEDEESEGEDDGGSFPLEESVGNERRMDKSYFLSHFMSCVVSGMRKASGEEGSQGSSSNGTNIKELEITRNSHMLSKCLDVMPSEEVISALR